MNVSGILITIIGLTGCAHSDEWTRANTILEITYQVSLIADAYQTTRIQYNPRILEINPITRSFIGEQPSTRDTAIYFATVGVSHFLIARALPRRWREIFQAGTAIRSVVTVYRNCQIDGC